VAAKPSTGAWFGLAAILENRQAEFEAWEQVTVTDGGLACPVCTEPLESGPPSAAGTVTRFCPFAGDHAFAAPRDVVQPRYGVMMGRTG
jgi:hypothetical protein